MPSHRYEPQPSDALYPNDNTSALYGFIRGEGHSPTRNSQEQYKLQRSGERPGRGLFSQSGRKVHLSQPRPNTGFSRPIQNPSLSDKGQSQSELDPTRSDTSPSHNGMVHQRLNMGQLRTEIGQANFRDNRSRDRSVSPERFHSPPKLPARNPGLHQSAFNSKPNQRSLSAERTKYSNNIVHTTRQPIDDLRDRIKQQNFTTPPQQEMRSSQRPVQQLGGPPSSSNSQQQNYASTTSPYQNSNSLTYNAHNRSRYDTHSQRLVSQSDSGSPNSRSPNSRGPNSRSPVKQQRFQSQAHSATTNSSQLHEKSHSLRHQTTPMHPPPRRHHVSQPTLPQPQHPPHRPVSNKYKMLVCPDFFPLAKLNQGNRSKKPNFDVAVPLDFTNHIPTPNQLKEIIPGDEPGFYGNQNGIPPELLTTMEDSFVEDPQEQLLYSSISSQVRHHQTASNHGNHNRTHNLSDYYFQVNLPSSQGKAEVLAAKEEDSNSGSSPYHAQS